LGIYGPALRFFKDLWLKAMFLVIWISNMAPFFGDTTILKNSKITLRMEF
jgi:hypothetical protein